MRVLLNGHDRELPPDATLASLVQLLKLDGTRVAAEVNLKLVRRADYATTLLQDGDRIEIVSLVGGG